MDTTLNKVPVLVLAFNRPDHVEQAMQAIREYKPERLYLECDGARPNKKGEAEAVALTRKTMLDLVDWPCEVKTMFRDKNLGCADAVYGAISWFFEHEEWGVIIEDDIVVSTDFFKLCEELLPRYASKDKIMCINAMNFIYDVYESNTYCFGKCESCWGWASWSRAWKKMDMNMEGVWSFNYFRLLHILGLFRTLMYWYYWSKDIRKIKKGKCSSWATRWNYSVFKNDGIVISANVNLAYNIGTSCGTHYQTNDINPYESLKIGHISWPLVHPKTIAIDKKQLKRDNQDFKRIRIIGLKKKIHRLIKSN